jgi:radical SAM protein with 4Fe4S-binding SPASM domain
VHELADVARLVREHEAAIWELFFLVRVGRGSNLEELTPDAAEDVCHFLFDASSYGLVVRTVEAPFFRRVVAWRSTGRGGEDPRLTHGLGPLYEMLAARLREQLGEPSSEPLAQTQGTRDGKGVVFVAHNGEVYPAGFLPLSLGNVRRESIVDIYRSHPLLRDIRAALFHGRCGECQYADPCGGSRARAFTSSGDALGEDPACAYAPDTARTSLRTQPVTSLHAHPSAR